MPEEKAAPTSNENNSKEGNNNNSEKTYMQELDEKHRQMQDESKKLEEKMQKMKREADEMMKYGSARAGQAQPQKTAGQESAERVNNFLKGHWANPAKGPGAQAFA